MYDSPQDNPESHSTSPVVENESIKPKPRVSCGAYSCANNSGNHA